jgi:hypothetical protein
VSPCLESLEERVALSHAKLPISAHTAAGFTSSSRIASNYVSWGMEDWQLGRSSFSIQIGNGTTPVEITSITAAISASALPTSNPHNRFMRQTLFSLSPSDCSANDVKIVSSPPANPQRWEHSVARSLVALDLKQVGTRIINYPMSIRFRPPVTLPNGQLTAVFDNESYTPIPSATTDECESLDTEIHIIIQYNDM